MYEVALRSCAKLGECGTALKLLRAMEGVVEPQGKKPPRVAYNLVLEAAANSNRHDQAMKLYREMVRDERVGVNVFTYGPLLTLCAKRGDGASALKLLDEMEKRGVQPNALTYTAAIDACERSGLREETVRLLREMKDKGVRPTVVTYNTIIARRAEHPDTWTEALDWLERLLVSGVEPDRLSFAAAINACERAQEWALVVELTEKAGLLADVTMLTRQINALLKLERYQDALGVMQQVKERELQPDEVLYTLVLKACALHGSTNEALYYLSDMRQAGLIPNVVTFSAAMDACKAVSSLGHRCSGRDPAV
jgi:pentatricopeptide repeat domain-containing protein 1